MNGPGGPGGELAALAIETPIRSGPGAAVATEAPAGLVLAIDTATEWVVIGLGHTDGSQIRGSAMKAGRSHGERLLRGIEGILDFAGMPRTALTGIVVGTGPGTFTGLRIGIATAKGIAHGLGIPIVGISTSAVLLEAMFYDWTSPTFSVDGPPADRPDLALLLPAGPQDRLLVHGGSTTVLPPGGELDLPAATLLIAVDLAGRAPDDAIQRGESAVRGFAETLMRMGTRRLAAGDTDDLAELVPEYVTLPRGVVRQTGEVAWSRDPR